MVWFLWWFAVVTPVNRISGSLRVGLLRGQPAVLASSGRGLERRVLGSRSGLLDPNVPEGPRNPYLNKPQVSLRFAEVRKPQL